MSTVIRNSVSKANPYYISKERYLELKHFCLQYPEWEQELKALDGYSDDVEHTDILESPGDSVYSVTKRRLVLSHKMELVKSCSIEAGGYISEYLFKGVTRGLSYVQLSMQYGLACGRDRYYEAYRRFYYILSNRI